MSRTVLRDVRVYRDATFGRPEDVFINDGVIGTGTADGPVAASGDT